MCVYVPIQVPATTNHGDDLAVSQESTKQGRFLCELCNTRFYHATALVSHYEDSHNKMLCRVIAFNKINVCICRFCTEVEIKSFPNWISFLSWKEEEEKLTYTYFVKPKGEVICGNGL